jgi:hypothetical protein
VDVPVLLDSSMPSYEDRLMYYCVFCFRRGRLAGSCGRTTRTVEAVFGPDELPELKWSSQRRGLAAWRAWREGLPWVIGQALP